MCGIVAISSAPASSFDLIGLLDTLRHRGPDGRGEFVSASGDCHLGHVRLAILDLTASGAQPMRDASGRHVIAFNGEIYNFRELQRDLERAYGPIAWRSRSDTEVVIEGFARQGPAFLDRLNGIFSLVIYEVESRTLHVLRDPLGIKPLFFTQQRGAVFFASELKALLALPGLKRTLRTKSLAEQLAFMYVPEPHTLYEEFLKAEPGVLTTFRDGVRLSSIRLFEWMKSPVALGSEHETIERFAQTFSAAVQRQTVSDAPVSLMLSGGLDSSAVGLEAVGRHSTLKEAYTIALDSRDLAHDKFSSDEPYARMMARELGLRLEVIPAHVDFVSLIPSLGRFVEDGISDPAAINTWLICRVARQNGIKVMLTGHGADEHLGGYRRYLAHQFLEAMPRPMRRMLGWLGRAIPVGVPGPLNALARRSKRVASLAGQSRDQQILNLYTWAPPAEIERLFVSRASLGLGTELLDLFHACAPLGDVASLMRVDHHYDLMSLNLTYTDRMSMAAGVEARVPFLDFELVRLMNSLPLSLKIRRGTPKYILKKAMEHRLPAKILDRQKTGFGLPIRAWLREESELVRHFLDRDRIARQGIFDADAVQSMCREQFAGKRDYGNLLFSMLCVQAWMDHHHGDAPWHPKMTTLESRYGGYGHTAAAPG